LAIGAAAAAGAAAVAGLAAAAAGAAAGFSSFFSRELGGIGFAYAFNALDEVVPVFEIAFFALVQNFGGNARANALDAIELSRSGFINIDGGKRDSRIEHGHYG
jgi:hypothetical protein